MLYYVGTHYSIDNSNPCGREQKAANEMHEKGRTFLCRSPPNKTFCAACSHDLDASWTRRRGGYVPRYTSSRLVVLAVPRFGPSLALYSWTAKFESQVPKTVPSWRAPHVWRLINTEAGTGAATGTATGLLQPKVVWLMKWH